MRKVFQIWSWSLVTVFIVVIIIIWFLKVHHKPKWVSFFYFPLLLQRFDRSRSSCCNSRVTVFRESLLPMGIEWSSRFSKTVIKICKNGHQDLHFCFTCNAPMPALPNVHIDGAAAKALANAFLHQEDKKPRDPKIKE